MSSGSPATRRLSTTPPTQYVSAEYVLGEPRSDVGSAAGDEGR